MQILKRVFCDNTAPVCGNTVFCGDLRRPGGKGGSEELFAFVEQICSGIEVSENDFSDILELEGLQEGIARAPPTGLLQALWETAPDGAVWLIDGCTSELEGALSEESVEEDIPDDAILRLENAVVLLARILAAFVPKAGKKDPLATASDDSDVPLGQRVVNAMMGVLFLHGFTVTLGPDGDELEDDSEDEDEDEDTQRPKRSDARVWERGIIGTSNPEEITDMPPDSPDVWERRRLGLEALLTVMRFGMSVVNRQDLDKRPDVLYGPWLKYLCDPSSEVPRRPELAFSLLAVALSHQPRGQGALPYLALLNSSNDEELVLLSLQALCLCLQCPGDSKTTHAGACMELEPQKSLGDNVSMKQKAPQAFRVLLDEICSDHEVMQVIEGINELMDACRSADATMLPGSLPKLPFILELLVVLYHFGASELFMAKAAKNVRLPEVICKVALYSIDEEILGRENKARGGMALPMLLVLLTRFTTRCEMVAELNTFAAADIAFENELNSPGMIDGSGLSLIVLVCCQHIRNHLEEACAASAGAWARGVVDLCMMTLGNVSAFAESLGNDAGLPLVTLLERISKAVLTHGSSATACQWLPGIVEVFENVVQYHYVGNLALAYGLLTHKKSFMEMRNTLQDAHASKEGTDVDSPKDLVQSSKWARCLRGLDVLVKLVDFVADELDEVLPKIQVQDSQDAEQLMPTCVLGYLPRPHPLILQTYGYSRPVSEALCVCLWSRVLHGPIQELFLRDEDDQDLEEEEEEEEEKQKTKKGKTSKRGKGKEEEKKGKKGKGRAREKEEEKEVKKKKKKEEDEEKVPLKRGKPEEETEDEQEEEEEEEEDERPEENKRIGRRNLTRPEKPKRDEEKVPLKKGRLRRAKEEAKEAKDAKGDEEAKEEKPGAKSKSSLRQDRLHKGKEEITKDEENASRLGQAKKGFRTKRDELMEAAKAGKGSPKASKKEAVKEDSPTAWQRISGFFGGVCKAEQSLSAKDRRKLQARKEKEDTDVNLSPRSMILKKSLKKESKKEADDEEAPRSKKGLKKPLKKEESSKNKKGLKKDDTEEESSRSRKSLKKDDIPEEEPPKSKKGLKKPKSFAKAAASRTRQSSDPDVDAEVSNAVHSNPRQSSGGYPRSASEKEKKEVGKAASKKFASSPAKDSLLGSGANDEDKSQEENEAKEAAKEEAAPQKEKYIQEKLQKLKMEVEKRQTEIKEKGDSKEETAPQKEDEEETPASPAKVDISSTGDAEVDYWKRRIAELTGEVTAMGDASKTSDAS